MANAEQKVDPVDPDADEADEIRSAFGEHVNMTAKELEDWLGTDETSVTLKKVNAYVERHLAQRPDKPAGGLEDAAWTRSLRNWGHDPLK